MNALSRRARHRRSAARQARARGWLGARAGELMIAADPLGLAALLAVLLVSRE
ncbi:hypothetical protein [Streptomyces johnsoniae]|uniref:Uncharacterized protein n=1 Tax=Streptomyces johnsoniae TaxID=3075532 RepID=A0ABU2RXM4_9ACTN|nr:hypothetical protein [Streptomyces sp. DSM 41886]MDT0441196.1 hypothetical protein [Streptomyces sp. DSM 41886]